MIVTPKEVLRAIADWIEADKKEKAKPKDTERGTYPLGFFSFGGGFSYDDEPILSEADKKLAVAEAALEAFVELRVQKVLKELVETSQQPRGHPCYPEELEKKQT